MFSAHCFYCRVKRPCMYSIPPGGKTPVMICAMCMYELEKKHEEGRDR